MTTADDSVFMARALRLAMRGQYTAHPNPRVGCVLVRDGEIIGEGYHRVTGDAHAEVNALREADSAVGATAYVTLEPCAHQGRTPPCCTALIDAGISRAVVAMLDPNPAVSGRGIAALSGAGVDVNIGLMEDAAMSMNEGFVSRQTRRRPFVRAKIAASLDGAIAMASGESQWITGSAARADVQRLRAQSGAILTGIGTVLADDPALTVRDRVIEHGELQPLRVVLDSDLRMSGDAAMLTLPGKTLVVHANGGADATLDGAELVRIRGGDGRVDIDALLAVLAEREVNDMLVEAGPTVLGSLLENGVVDELIIYQAPHIMGSQTRTMAKTPGWTRLADRMALRIVDVRRVGSDLRLTLRPNRSG